MSTASISFDKASYTTTDDIVVTITTDAPVSESLIVTGHVVGADGVEVDFSGSTTVTGGTFSLDPVAGYNTAQDAGDPAVFTLTPAA